MNQLERRVERLEQRTGAKHVQRLIYIMPNLEEGEGEETPYQVKISSVLWAHAFGRSFTEQEIRGLREEYGNRRSGNEPEAES